MQVIIPGADGMFGVLPGHVPTISELKPGVVEVTTAPGEVEKYFISSGFCFAHADSTLDVCGIEVRVGSACLGCSAHTLACCPRTLPSFARMQRPSHRLLGSDAGLAREREGEQETRRNSRG